MEAAAIESGEPLRVLIENCVRTGSAGQRLQQIEVIFGMNAGSFAFNLNVATSDRDYFGVYAAHAEDVLQPLSQPPTTIDSHVPFDHAIHEAAQYCSLLLKGNPKLIEPLYVSHRYYASESWRELSSQRAHFMTQVTAKQYFAYASSQLGDTKDGKGIEAKKFYHCLRLLQEAEAIVNGGHPRVWWEGEEREKLLAVRAGKIQTAELETMVKALREKISPLIEKLPPKTDIAVLDAWLIKLRSKTITSLPPRLVLPATSRSQGSLRAAAEALLAKHQLQGAIICALPSGSRLHGTATATSSHDWIGVFALPTTRMFALAPPARIIDDTGVDVSTNITYTRGGILLELNYACSLIRQGNLRLLELLFADEKVLAEEAYATEGWAALTAQRKDLVGLSTAKACVGMATAVLQRGSKGGKGAKEESVRNEQADLVHTLRLLLEAERLIQDGRPQVHWRGNAMLEAARTGAAGTKEAATKMLQQVNSMMPGKGKVATTGISQDAVDFINRWAVTIRKELYGSP